MEVVVVVVVVVAVGLLAATVAPVVRTLPSQVGEEIEVTHEPRQSNFLHLTLRLLRGRSRPLRSPRSALLGL